MNFSSAFKYPFQNIAKVISIVLVLTIAFSAFTALTLNSYDWTPLVGHLYGYGSSVANDVETMAPLNGPALVGLLGLLVTAALSGFWLSGYSVEVIRSVLNEEEWLPTISFSHNLKDGFYLFVSSIAYWLLFVGAIIVAILAVTITSSIGILSALVGLASVVGIVALCSVMGWAYFVGMARIAVEGDPKASWHVWANLRTARADGRAGFKLLLYLVALTLVYSIVRGAVDGIFGGITGSNLLAGMTLSIIIYYFFNLMQHFSTQHLIAQYASNIGIGSAQDDLELDKDKVDFT